LFEKTSARFSRFLKHKDCSWAVYCHDIGFAI